MLICVRNLELTYELHNAIKLNFIDARNDAVVVGSGSKHFTLQLVTHAMTACSGTCDGCLQWYMWWLPAVVHVMAAISDPCDDSLFWHK